jgi:hypothetical protein
MDVASDWRQSCKARVWKRNDNGVEREKKLQRRVARSVPVLGETPTDLALLAVR